VEAIGLIKYRGGPFLMSDDKDPKTPIEKGWDAAASLAMEFLCLFAANPQRITMSNPS